MSSTRIATLRLAYRINRASETSLIEVLVSGGPPGLASRVNFRHCGPAQAEHTLKVEQEIKLKQGHAEGLNRAITIQRSRVLELVEKLRPKLAADLEKRLAEERNQIEDAIDAVGRAQQRRVSPSAWWHGAATGRSGDTEDRY